MSDFNKVTLIGRLTADPQSKYTQGGMEVSDFSIANNYYAGRENNNEVNYFNVIAFGKMAEVANKYLTKGKQVLISGSLRQERWQEKSTNKTKSRVIIILSSMQMLGGKKEAYNNNEEEEEIPF